MGVSPAKRRKSSLSPFLVQWWRTPITTCEAFLQTCFLGYEVPVTRSASQLWPSLLG